MEAQYKIWLVSYDWYGSYGSYDRRECVVIAEIESKAIGIAVQTYPDTVASCWSAIEIPFEEGLTYISSRCS